jgi:hypothetical protein
MCKILYGKFYPRSRFAAKNAKIAKSARNTSLYYFSALSAFFAAKNKCEKSDYKTRSSGDIFGITPNLPNSSSPSSESNKP